MFGNVIPMLDKSLDYLWKKQEVTASNIANVDTPGYKKKSVEFEQSFKRELEAAAHNRRSVKQAINRADYQVVEEPGTVRADGNGVNADVEYTELTRTALQYQYLVQSVSSDITRYRTAIKGQ